MEDEKDLYIQKLKQDLSELKKYLEDFLLFLPLPVCSVNPLGIVVDANQAFYNLTGYGKGEGTEGESIFRVEVLFKDKRQWESLKNKIINKEIIKGEEITIITKKGEKIPVSLSASFREDESGELGGYFLALLDITEIKALQENLEQKVKERTEELQEKVAELEKFVKLTVGRELRMRELKQQLKELKNKDE